MYKLGEVKDDRILAVSIFGPQCVVKLGSGSSSYVKLEHSNYGPKYTQGPWFNITNMSIRSARVYASKKDVFVYIMTDNGKKKFSLAED